MKKATKVIINKPGVFIAAVIFVVLSTLLAACSTGADTKTAVNPETEKFKNEYEALNGRTTPDGEHIYKNVEIPNSVKIEYVNGQGAMALLSEEGGESGAVIYMGFPECPWCRTLLPPLMEACGESGYAGTVYYYNGLADRDVKSLSEDGQIVTEEEGTEAYRDLVAILYDHLSPYKGLEDDAVKRIYFPTTIFFKGGAVLSVHLTTIPSQESGYDELTPEEYQALKADLVNEFSALSK
jgi:hypothetical protein